MSVGAGDPSPVEWESEQLMRRFVAARDAGDRDAMRAAWSGLVRVTWPRLRSAVQAHGAAILSPAEREDALSNAGERMTRLAIWRFSGTTLAELGAFVARVAKLACLDEQRKAARRREHEAPLDGGGDGEDRPDRADVIAAERERADVAVAEDEEAEQELYADGRDFLDWALPQLTPKRREVMDLLRGGASREHVMDKLGMSRNTVDANVSRAMKDLNELKEQYES